jgi:hypothetical protein
MDDYDYDEDDNDGRFPRRQLGRGPLPRSRQEGRGDRARRYWARWLPGPYAEIRDPDEFFTVPSVLQEDVAAQVHRDT